MKIATVATQHYPANRPVLPEWTRWSWSSLDERDYWKTRIGAASQCWDTIERLSVAAGVRPGCYQMVRPEELVNMSTWAVKHGLVAVPIAKAQTKGAYSSASSSIVAGEPFQYRVLFVRPDQMSKLSVLDDDELGTALGYPDCCRKFFAETWAAGQIDTTWDQHMNSNTIGVLHPECNVLWRWLGIRLVSHLPCSYHCEATKRIGAAVRQVGIDNGYADEMATIDAILRWPVKFSALNGIAEITGPCVKISTRTDWSPELRTFERPGVYWKPNPKTWVLNGFKSAEAMDAAHRPFLSMLKEFVPQDAKSLLDLGCGTGRLATRIGLLRPGMKCGGIDLNAEAIALKGEPATGAWTCADIADIDLWPIQSPEVVLFMPGRLMELQETNAIKADELRMALLATPQVFVYMYGDWNQKYKSDLTKLCADAKLPQPAIVYSSPTTTIGIITRVN